MPASSSQLREWRDALAALRTRVAQTVLPLTPAVRSRTPASGGWSVDQIIEHLAITNALYAASMRSAMASAHGASSGNGEWTPSWIGGMLRNSVAPSAQRKLKSPRRSKPGPQPSPLVLERFVEGIDELVALAEQAEALDLKRVRFASPLLGIIRLNLGDGFAICVAHVERHANQIARTIAANKAAV